MKRVVKLIDNYWLGQVHNQYPKKINVCPGMIDNNVIGRFFLEGNRTRPRYSTLLRNNIVPAFATLYPDLIDPLIPFGDIVLAPVHYSRIVRQY